MISAKNCIFGIFHKKSALQGSGSSRRRGRFLVHYAEIEISV
jgi:hypothetical protein